MTDDQRVFYLERPQGVPDSVEIDHFTLQETIAETGDRLLSGDESINEELGKLLAMLEVELEDAFRLPFDMIADRLRTALTRHEAARLRAGRSARLIGPMVMRAVAVLTAARLAVMQCFELQRMSPDDIDA